MVFPFLGEFWDAGGATIEVVGDVDFAGGCVDGADEGVGADVGEVAFVFQPGAGGGDGVGCAFAGYFVEDFEVLEVGLGEGGEGFEEGQAV